MKIGTLVDKPVCIEGYDLTSYYVKSCTGKISKPGTGVINIISCFADNKTARSHPEWIARSSFGKSNRRNRFHRFLWDTICPSVDYYGEKILHLVNQISKSDVAGVRLDCIGFPRLEYCTCERCLKKKNESGLEFNEWRSKTISDFVSSASEIVKANSKSFSVTVMPDPWFGNERFGEDLKKLEELVDFFIIPLYDMEYSTTYWLETFCYGFKRSLKKPFFIELYAANPGPSMKNLLNAIVSVSRFVNGLFLATHKVALARAFQEELIKSKDYYNFLDRKNCESMLNIIKKWKAKFS